MSRKAGMSRNPISKDFDLALWLQKEDQYLTLDYTPTRSLFGELKSFFAWECEGHSSFQVAAF